MEKDDSRGSGSSPGASDSDDIGDIDDSAPSPSPQVHGTATRNLSLRLLVKAKIPGALIKVKAKNRPPRQRRPRVLRAQRKSLKRSGPPKRRPRTNQTMMKSLPADGKPRKKTAKVKAAKSISQPENASR